MTHYLIAHVTARGAAGAATVAAWGLDRRSRCSHLGAGPLELPPSPLGARLRWSCHHRHLGQDYVGAAAAAAAWGQESRSCAPRVHHLGGATHGKHNELRLKRSHARVGGLGSVGDLGFGFELNFVDHDAKSPFSWAIAKCCIYFRLV